eukprot:scaffold32956_cov33-Phaeocystis_antarctica.AAC.1
MASVHREGELGSSAAPTEPRNEIFFSAPSGRDQPRHEHAFLPSFQSRVAAWLQTACARSTARRQQA